MAKVIAVALSLLAVFSAANCRTVRSSEEKYLYYQLENGTIIKDDISGPIAEVLSIDTTQLHYHLYTQKNINNSYELIIGDLVNLENSGFDASKPTKIITHGFVGSYADRSVQEPKNAYLETSDVNVIIADWKAFNFPYLSAVSKVKPIGTNIGDLIAFLRDNAGLQLKNVHIIGHSLGAHVASFAANRFAGGELVHRVTGLDPAGPVIGLFFPSGRLDASDADYVDCIHTSNLLGITYAAGDYDFFPNGGTKQPRCGNEIAQVIAGTCDHGESWRYLVDSIKKPDTYKGIQCNSDNEAVAKRCHGPVAGVMGESALDKSTKGIFYVDVESMYKV